MKFKEKITKLVITSGYRWNYFEWFLLGFKDLEKRGIINIEYDLPVASRLLMHSNSELCSNIINHLKNVTETDTYNMEGYFVYENGDKKYFCIDSADSPFLFDESSLKRVTTYFKMQCPKNLDDDSFKLTDKVSIPWSDHAHKDLNLNLTDPGERRVIKSITPYKSKIKPLMIGPRQLAVGCGYKALKKGYDNYLNDQTYNKSKKIMCYFGNAAGPGMKKNVVKPDFDWEKDLMGYYKNNLSHPNEKRAKVAKYIEKLPSSDARIISQGNSDSNAKRNEKLIIPLKDFCKHISKFQYNMNVSGYRLSIPNRFIESFMVGTAIFTDKLSVKWYKSFDDEVRETVEMGYLPINEVDWKGFENDLRKLPESNPEKVIKTFRKKWAPEVVARYIIDTVSNS
ncbi:hypothetical protein AYP82_08240 [Lactobacillus crispatus]|uniref:Glycosyltransferase family 1 protein n=1 Tax=Lactobacillus crispatus TaxID=47770 RepID=A0A854PSD1_9LACO|nr:hypothetical protein [Lactobacillus crispatus]OXC22977.1 hypothetical protein AYP82_08240 [Lactobacillus crispatus]OXC36046.1 hypothetical protein AYP91_10080 [Lactobacillus crispatus]